jgi:transcriptional/translational regulatory protein YebC/TACO1
LNLEKEENETLSNNAFTRIGKDIVMAVKEGGPNPDVISRLRALSRIKENVERAIKKSN